ncbi:hypothetical protein HBH98_223920 [Parastagonospora nodorum]|nr:hypothetical protein HBH50_232310 [Parastagonospora nodorum]KAH4078968.1 hypothetical protein HBH48_225780 [Parastagonospora nodorum]KAH4215967.1 hypothetical protein HBI06_238370 [Parastagonospora nodorum]KAH4226625.1 hypothetical protein HBI05_218300 [Parastagonospora nodorum]KAH4337445.1 hypothetical protein HBH98_223920 [Parastagonospora nodorum]
MDLEPTLTHKGTPRKGTPINAHLPFRIPNSIPSHTHKIHKKLKPTKPTGKSTLLKLEPPASTTLSEHKLLSSKWTPLERITLLLLSAIGIISAIEPLLELRIRKDLVRLIDISHFLLGLFGSHVDSRGLVRVVHFAHFAVGALDFALAGVAGEAEDFVVVLGFGAFEEGLGFGEEFVDLLVLLVVFLGVFEGAHGVFEVVGFELGLALVDEAVEGVWVELERFVAVGRAFLGVAHFDVGFAGHLDEVLVQALGRVLVDVAGVDVFLEVLLDLLEEAGAAIAFVDEEFGGSCELTLLKI